MQNNEQIRRLIELLKYCASEIDCNGCAMDNKAVPERINNLVRKAAMVLEALAEEREIMSAKLKESKKTKLLTNDELIYALQCCCPDPIYDDPKCDKCPMTRNVGESGETWCSVELLGQARRAIESAQRMIPKWKYPRECMPEEYELRIGDDKPFPEIIRVSDWVLVWPKSLLDIGVYGISRARRYNGKWECENGFLEDDSVVCWMELPEPPEFEKEGF